MGVKKSAKKTKDGAKGHRRDRSSKQISGEVEVLAAASKSTRKPGKPTWSDEDLVGRRDRWAHLLETYWGRVGWELKCARTAGAIRAALQPLAEQGDGHLVAMFVRPSLEAAHSSAIRETKKEVARALSRLEETEKGRNTQAESLKQAEAAAFEFSEGHEEGLLKEVQRRKENLRQMKIRLSVQKGEIRKKELVLERAGPQDQPRLKAELESCRAERDKMAAECTEEPKVITQIQERVSAITLERRRQIADILVARRAAFAPLEQAALDAKGELERTETKLRNQEAFFSQAALLNHIRGKRYSHTPRKLANAVAGLPEMNCRRSAARCAKLPYTWGPNMAYLLFLFLEKVWRSRHPGEPASPAQLFRAAIAQLPRMRLVPGLGRRENYFRRYVEENWAYLKPAIEDAVPASKHPSEVPFRIATLFQENIGKPRTQADILFAEQQRLS